MSRLPTIHLTQLKNAFRAIGLKLHQMLQGGQRVMPMSRGHKRVNQSAKRLNVVGIGTENLTKESRCPLIVSLSSFCSCLLERRTLRHTFRRWRNKQAG